MGRALSLARRGLGRVEPNPMVGCVIARGMRIVGEGYHRRFGGPHAEIVALRAAGGAARGATAYVTLEPCSHVGKTPPCVDALIESGIGCVVAAMKDPNAPVAGKGFRALRAAGIDVHVGCLRGEAAELNGAYLTVVRKRRPYVILKWAQSLDGRLTTPRGASNAISGVAAHRWVHRLRARMDAIVIGVNTANGDDPRLTARGVALKRVATRVVLDSQLRTRMNCALVRSARRVPTLILTTRSGLSRSGGAARRVVEAGVEVEVCRAIRGRVDVADALGRLWRRGMTNVLIEGGATVLTGVLSRGLAEEAIVFVAPRVIGGVPEAVVFDRAIARGVTVSSRKVGDDMMYEIGFQDG